MFFFSIFAGVTITWGDLRRENRIGYGYVSGAGYSNHVTVTTPIAYCLHHGVLACSLLVFPFHYVWKVRSLERFASKMADCLFGFWSSSLALR